MRASPLARYSWSMFDWANQPFYTLITTFVFSYYFSQVFIADDVRGPELWGYTQTIAGLSVALLSPILGSIADLRGNRKPWIMFFSIAFVISTCFLWFALPGAPNGVWLIMIAMTTATAAIAFAEVFNNAMLPSIETDDKVGYLSGLGYGLGYFGGLVALILFLFFFVNAEVPPFGLDAETFENIRIVGPIGAFWYALFIVPFFLFTPDVKSIQISVINSIRQGLQNFFDTIRKVRDFKNVITFLFARMFYQDALNAMFIFGGIYAAQVLDWGFQELLILGIIVNIFAAPGAILGGWFNDKIGAKRVVMISVVGLMVTAVMAVSITRDTLFFVIPVDAYSYTVNEYTFGLYESIGEVVYVLVVIFLGTFSGPAQAASRALMSNIAPRKYITEFFGLFAFAGKATSWLAPAIIAFLTAYYESLRIGMGAIIVFTIIGLIALMYVKETRE